MKMGMTGYFENGKFIMTEMLPTLTNEQMAQLPTGTKHDQGKTRVDLLDAEFLEAVGEVLRFGAAKYGDSNWRGGITVGRLIASLLRHLFAVMRGQDIDSESGLRHTAHIGCNAMFLHWMFIHRPDLDNRYKG
jgi:hypothetical protein